MRYSIKKSYGFKLGEFYPSLGGWFLFFKSVNSLLRKHFDFLHKPHPTVPMYADGCEMFGFGSFLTACQRVKKYFFDTLLRASRWLALRYFLGIIIKNVFHFIQISFTIKQYGFSID